MKVKHFAGLDGLRFISIAFVVLHHLFTFKANFGFTTFDYPILGLIGLFGIQFFFMGSGFLITYLLLHEHDTLGRISLKNFFVRRILRIWPAYYLLIVLFLIIFKFSFFRIPGITDAYLQADYERSNSLYLLFLPHIQPFIFPTSPLVHHTYTIGIEEQFYIIWGLLFYFFRKYIVTILIIILLAMPALNFLHALIYKHAQSQGDESGFLHLIPSVITYFKYSRFSTFAIGSLFGYAYFYEKAWISYFKMMSVQFIVYAILVISILYRIEVPYFQYEYMSFLMACLMLMATCKKESLINYSARWVSYLGKISYGIYLFHLVAIVIACRITGYFFENESGIFVTIMLCLLTMAFSIVFGELSYHFYESYFLKLKQKFSLSSKKVSDQILHSNKKDIEHKKLIH